MLVVHINLDIESEPLTYRELKQLAVQQVEVQIVRQAYEYAHGNISQAAKILNMNRKHLDDLLKRYGLKRMKETPK